MQSESQKEKKNLKDKEKNILSIRGKKCLKERKLYR